MKKNQKLCMFCGKDKSHGSMSREHFVPKCLWEKGHRPLRTRTVWAHGSCNSSCSEDNEYFRDVLLMEEGADNNEAARTVAQGAFKRKLDEQFGSVCKAIKNPAMRPVTTLSGIYLGHQHSFEVDWTRIRRVLFNVMKGIFQTIEKRPMPEDFMWGVQDVRFLEMAPYDKTIQDMVPWQSFGDDAFLCRYRFMRRPETVGLDCLMQFYRNRVFFGQAVSPTYIESRFGFVPFNTMSTILVPSFAADKTVTGSMATDPTMKRNNAKPDEVHR